MNDQKERLVLPSRYKHGDEVRHILMDAAKVHKARVIKVMFTESSVSYDVELECYWNTNQTPKPGHEPDSNKAEYYYTRLYNIGSSFLEPVN